MKRILLSFVAIIITSVSFAQDIIVQKDGSTIQAKVTKVTQSEVEYKKFNNQNGPTYSISTKDLQCINYQNGTKDTFVSPNYNPNIVTNETATQFSNDQQLLQMYNASNNLPKIKKAKVLKTVGWIAGGSITTFGVLGTIAGFITGDDQAIGPLILCGGIGTWAAFYFSGKHIDKKYANMVHSASIYQQELNIGKNDRLLVGVDVLKDNTYRTQTLGLGVSYNF